MKLGDKVWVLCEVVDEPCHGKVKVVYCSLSFLPYLIDCKPIEPESVEQTETVGPKTIRVGDRVTWSGRKGVASEWCKHTKKFRFQADNGSVIWVFESSLSPVEPETVEQPTSDPVNPSHYKQGPIECIEAIKAALGVGFIAYLWGNILKYLWRWPNKNGIEDLKKAMWYLDRLIQEEEAK